MNMIFSHFENDFGPVVWNRCGHTSGWGFGVGEKISECLSGVGGAPRVRGRYNSIKVNDFQSSGPNAFQFGPIRSIPLRGQVELYDGTSPTFHATLVLYVIFVFGVANVLLFNVARSDLGDRIPSTVASCHTHRRSRTKGGTSSRRVL